MQGEKAKEEEQQSIVEEAMKTAKQGPDYGSLVAYLLESSPKVVGTYEDCHMEDTEETIATTSTRSEDTSISATSWLRSDTSDITIGTETSSETTFEAWAREVVRDYESSSSS